MPTSTTLAQELRWRRWSTDPAAFFREVWKIQHPEQGAILFDLFEEQERALEKFQVERLLITLKSRQIGWTTLVAAYAFWLAFFHPDRLVIFLSKGEREAAAILKMVKYGYDRLPRWVKDRGPGKGEHWNTTQCELDNGSAVESLPSKKDPARGRSCYLVVVDEWAFLENPEEAWASIEAVADVGGRIFGLSTANGYGNFFHTTWEDAVLGQNDFVTLFEPWWARSGRDQDWYDTKARNMPAWQLHQEYPSTPEEAFIKSGNPYFDVDKLLELEVRTPLRGYLYSEDIVRFQEAGNGPLSVYEYPQDDETYVIGADVAEGLEHGDYCSAHVIRWRTNEVVAVWHGHIAPDAFSETLADLGRFYNTALIGPEANNHGLTTCKYLQDWHKYPNIFFARIIDERSKKITQKIGWATTKKTRPVMLDELASMVREGSLGLADKPTIHELRTFVRDEYGRLRGSPFDDRTMSLAIAVQMKHYVTSPSKEQTQQAPWGTLKFWEGRLHKPSKREPIGAHNVR